MSPQASGSRSAVRIAVISTPRAGNTWLRKLLGQLYNVPQIAVHSMTNDDWERLPEQCLFQMHTHRTPETTERLSRLGFKVVTLTRHPLDTLISILHFAPFEPQVARWLEGECGTEQETLLAPPSSPVFCRYATGPRATVLLNVSREWWNQPGCVNLRYEDLVGDTPGQLERLVDHFGWTPNGATIQQVIEDCSMESLRKIADNNHFWKGQPGGWKRFLVASVAETIASTHSELFQTFGYDCDPDASLTAEAANEAWLRMLQQDWWDYVRKAISMRQELDQLRVEHDRLHEVVHELQTQQTPPAPIAEVVTPSLLTRMIRRWTQPVRRSA